MAIILYATKYIREENNSKFLIAVIIAGLFHYASFFMIIFFVLFNTKDELKRKRLTILASIVVPIAFVFIARFLVPLLGAKRAGYTLHGISMGDIIGCFSKLPIYIVIKYFSKSLNCDEDQEILIDRLTTICGFSIIIELSSLIVSLGRLVYFTDAILWILLPMLCSCQLSKRKETALVSITCAYGVLMMFVTQFMVGSHFNTLVPYVGKYFSF